MKSSRSVTALWTCVSGSLLNLIYPRRCPLCHQVMKEQRRLICPECEKDLHPITGPRCYHCGKPIKEGEEYCADCRSHPGAFTAGKGIFLYDDRMKASMMKYKYSGCREYGRFFGRAMCVYGEDSIRRWSPDLIVPVPMTAAKLRQRGFNQACTKDQAYRCSEGAGCSRTAP